MATVRKYATTPRKIPPPTKPKPTCMTPAAKEAKNPVEVYCRLRPLRSQNDETCIKRVNEHTLGLARFGAAKFESFYTFKYIFPESAQQKDVFDRIGSPLLKDLIHGKNGLLFTYGITSSGKTFTLTGTSTNCGVLPRTLDVLFNSVGDNLCRKFTFNPDGSNGFEVRSPPDALIEWQKFKQVSRTPSAVTPRVNRRENDDLKEWDQRDRDDTRIELQSKGNGFAVFVTYVEIYNNYIYDLLDQETFSDVEKQPRSRILREDKRRKVFVYGAKEVEVRSADEAFDLFVKGVRRRRMAHTALNTESSRSHSVFNIKVVQAPLDNDGDVIPDAKLITTSQLSLVDLAGSERTQRTQNTGERLREAGNINNSLMALRTCIELLRENQKFGVNKLIPYRDNKLTHLFKSYFEGEGKIKMVICVNPGSADFDESLHVLKFAETAQEVLINRAVDMPFHLRMPHPYSSPIFNSYPSVDALATEFIRPPLPAITSIDFKDKNQIAKLIETLELRKKNSLRCYEKVRQKQMMFRECLISIENESMLTKHQLETIRNDLKIREDSLKELETKCSLLESDHEEGLRKIYSLERQIHELEEQLDQKNQALNHADIDCVLTKAAAKEKIAREKERLRRAFEKALREKQALLEREQCLTKEKIHLVKEILSADNLDWGVFSEYWDSIYPNADAQTNNDNGNEPNPGSRRSTLPESTPQKASTPTKPQPYSRSKLRAKLIQRNGFHIGESGEFINRRPSLPDSIDTTPSKGTPDKTSSSQSTTKRLRLAFEPGPSMDCTPSLIPNYPESASDNLENCHLAKYSGGIPVVNPRHIRSLASGSEKWIDHRPQDELDLGTILKPKIKNKISVTNLKEIDSDELRRASKYAITTHTADDQGDVETRIYKGEVIPSATGGAQVIFNDVEMMVQSPPSKL